MNSIQSLKTNTCTTKKITIASIKSQWPVKTQKHTTVMDKVKLNNSSAVKRPQHPKDIRFPLEQGRIIY